MKKYVKASMQPSYLRGYYKPKYVVWIAWTNYEGDLQDKTPIAMFWHPNRAQEYLDECNSTNSDPNTVFGLDDLNEAM